MKMKSSYGVLQCSVPCVPSCINILQLDRTKSVTFDTRPTIHGLVGIKTRLQVTKHIGATIRQLSGNAGDIMHFMYAL